MLKNAWLSLFSFFERSKMAENDNNSVAAMMMDAMIAYSKSGIMGPMDETVKTWETYTRGLFFYQLSQFVSQIRILLWIALAVLIVNGILGWIGVLNG